MNRKTIQAMKLIIFMAIILPIIGAGAVHSQGGQTSWAKATFYVF